MRVLGTILVIVGLALLALPATAQTTGQTSFTLLAKNQGGSYVWTDESGNQVNPTLTVPAGQEVTIVAKQGAADQIPHNIKVGQNPTSATFTDEGESVEYKFTLASGSAEYICAIHPTTMKGTVRVAGADGGSGGDTGDKESPSLGLVGALVALAGAALLVARRN